MVVPTLSDEPFREITGPILLLAGPGTGKTYQLAKRMQFLVDEQRVSPEAITVITFTKEATLGMRAKIGDDEKAEYIEPEKRPKNILTMHSLGHRIIEENAASLGLQRGVAVVKDVALKKGLMRDAALLGGFDEPAGEAALADKETANTAASAESQTIQAMYSRILTSCNAIDFDDQIAIACKILERQPDLLKSHQAAAQHLLVDEYQDINADQHRLITLLTSGQTEGLFAVGDDDQSIYGFRGGDPRYIRSFAEDYPDCKVLQLGVSRRCRKNILDCALSVVATYDPARVPKSSPQYTEAEPGTVQVWNCPSEIREADLIAKAIYSKAAKDTAKSFFILVMNRNYVAPIAAALAGLGIQHDNSTSGIGAAEWQQLKTVRRWLEEPTNLRTREAIEMIVRGRTTSIPSARVRTAEKRAARHRCAQELAELWTVVLGGEMTLLASMEAADTTQTFCTEVKALLTSVKGAYTDGDVPPFLEAVRRGIGIFPSVDTFYRCLTLLESEPRTQSAPSAAVRILTYQSSKGLEADCVFVVGLEEASMPRNIDDDQRTSEEARLFFVAMTRARNELHITHARKRTGASTFKPESRQLKESAFLRTFPSAQSEKKYVAPKSAKKKARSKPS